MKSPPVKPHWLERAIIIYNFHAQQCKEDSSWTLTKTAKSLNRSIGSISQDILIASWSKTHEKQLNRCNNAKDALSWIKMRQRELKLEEI